MSDKRKFPYKQALSVAEKIVQAMVPMCSRLAIAGSLRRKKPEVGDIEIVYVPRMTEVADPTDMFGRKVFVNAVDIVLNELIARGSLAKRMNALGAETWGESNKFAVAIKTGIPVDFFATGPEAWFNYLVCRTGSAETNMRIATAAQAKHCQWCPTRAGFLQTWASGERRLWLMKSERDVFEFVNIPYLEPEAR